MDTRKYVNDLFSGYEETPTLTDFKEELQSNLDDRIANLIKKGMPEQAAFEKATTELGDISALADEICLKKKKEVYSEMYMKTRNYMDKWHVFGYVLAGGLMAFGIINSLLAYFASGEIVAGLGSLMVFLVVPVCGFVMLGLTQETARNYPMGWKRALVYAAVVGVILFGLVIFTMTLFSNHDVRPAVASIGSLIPFALPGSLVLALLLLTEKSRHKPWVVRQEADWAEQMKEQFDDPYVATRFGLFSGALWMFAIALFVAFGFLIGFQYSWLVFLFAIAGQILMQAFMMPKTKNNG